jgi:hypothetical protein
MDEVFPEILDAIDAALEGRAEAPPEAILAMGETVLEAWLAARGEAPGEDRPEGFRLLGLHRQGCKGAPSFNACRETCREIVFRGNVAALYDDDAQERAHQLRLMAMTLRHLALFVGGKLTEVGLGAFCCSSRPLHQPGAA